MVFLFAIVGASAIWRDDRQRTSPAGRTESDPKEGCRERRRSRLIARRRRGRPSEGAGTCTAQASSTTVPTRGSMLAAFGDGADRAVGDGRIVGRLGGDEGGAPRIGRKLARGGTRENPAGRRYRSALTATSSTVSSGPASITAKSWASAATAPAGDQLEVQHDLVTLGRARSCWPCAAS